MLDVGRDGAGPEVAAADARPAAGGRCRCEPRPGCRRPGRRGRWSTTVRAAPGCRRWWSMPVRAAPAPPLVVDAGASRARPAAGGRRRYEPRPGRRASRRPGCRRRWSTTVRPAHRPSPVRLAPGRS
ncbi:hypothetical protein NKH77_35350 [Streptomyces sp. M19]